MTSGFIDSNEIPIYYETEGNGDPLILLHGGPGVPHDYLQDTRALAPFARLVFFDQRGTGKSGKSKTLAYTLETNVEDTENVRKKLNLGHCAIFGHSWGGMLAQAYTLKYPDNVRKLILANTFSTVDHLNDALAKMRASMPQKVQEIYEEYERSGLYNGRDHYPDQYQSAVDTAYEPISISVPKPAYLQDAFRRMSSDVYRTMWGDETEFRVTGTMSKFNFLPRLSEIRVPTLVIVGAKDMTTIEMAQETTRRIPKARLVIFEKSRHYPFIEEKEKFVQVMKEFLADS
jgi:proline-specific peptidase